MSKHEELIERLRCFDRVTCNEAADALEAQAREIEATERQAEVLTDALAESRREIEGLRKDAERWISTAQAELDGVETDDANNCLKAAHGALGNAMAVVRGEQGAPHV